MLVIIVALRIMGQSHYIGRALSVNRSLEDLTISNTSIGDEGVAHIAIALQRNNNTLKLLTLSDHINILTDKAALSLAAALKTNTSMNVMKLGWTFTHPDTTLKKMAEFIKESTLRELKLEIDAPHPLGEPQVSLEEAREWCRCLEVGGKEFILSLEDSRLEIFLLIL